MKSFYEEGIKFTNEMIKYMDNNNENGIFNDEIKQMKRLNKYYIKELEPK
jgi:hypothetical protein